MNKKAVAASIICMKPMSLLANKFINDKCIRILAYHRILNFTESVYPFDEELISASIEQFDTQMHYVSQNYNVINFHHLNEIEAGRSTLPERPLVITFDDGYLDNYEYAYPILKKYNLTAVFYLSTDYIGSDNIFWFEQLIYCGKKDILPIEKLRPFLDQSFSCLEHSPIEYAKQLRWYMMNLKNAERLVLMKFIERIISENLSHSDLKLVSTMSWGNVKDMAMGGMEIGSHTKSHLILTNASIEEFTTELADSKQIIEQIINKDVVSISYPVGNMNFQLSDGMLKKVEKAGYRWGVSYVSGCSDYPFESGYSLPRLKVERYTSFATFKAKLMIPALFK